MSMKKVRTPQDMIFKKQASEKFVVLTAFDYLTARALSEEDIAFILVGDSLGNVFSGYKNTLPVTLDQIIYHTKAVVKGASEAVVIADMPFMTYQISASQAVENAGRLIKETGAQAVKLEVNPYQLELVSAIVQSGIPVIGHIGLTPQMVYQMGGYKVQGRDEKSRKMLEKMAKDLSDLGCVAVLLEMVVASVAKQITDNLDVPVIGIGSGPNCDAQILVTQDVLGMSEKSPKFAKQYASFYSDMRHAIASFKGEVLSGSFPSSDHYFE